GRDARGGGVVRPALAARPQRDRPGVHRGGLHHRHDPRPVPAGQPAPAGAVVGRAGGGGGRGRRGRRSLGARRLWAGGGWGALGWAWYAPVGTVTTVAVALALNLLKKSDSPQRHKEHKEEKGRM